MFGVTGSVGCIADVRMHESVWFYCDITVDKVVVKVLNRMTMSCTNV